MRILMINHHRWYRSGFRAGALARKLAERGHDVSLMVVADKARFHFEHFNWDGVNVIATPDMLVGRARSGWDPLSAMRRKAWLKRNAKDWEVIHLFETRPATIIPGLWLSKYLERPFFTDWIDWWGRGGLIEVNRPRWYKLLFGRIETFFEENYRPLSIGTTVISRGLADRAVGLGIQKEAILHLRPGIDIDKFPLTEVTDARQKLGKKVDELWIGFSSQDSFLDLEPVLGAFSRLRKRRSDARLILIGSVLSKVKEEIVKHGLADSVIAPGFVPDEWYPWWLAACDMFLMPFSNENYNLGRWPNKFGDYLAVGRPIIFNPIGDLTDFVRREAPGIPCDCSERGFFGAIERLADDPALTVQLGGVARTIAETEFRWEERIDALEGFYRRRLSS